MRGLRNDWRIGVVAGGLTGIAFGVAGFFMAEIPTTHAMGPVMFLVVPFAAGFAIAIATRGNSQIIAAANLAVIGSLAILIATKLETFLCALMAMPLLFAGLVVGILAGVLFRKLIGKAGANEITLAFFGVAAMPFVVFVGHHVEKSTLVHPREEVVTSSIRLSETPDHVWNDLRSFDSVESSKPWLMYVGLPIPQRCVMHGSGLGSVRTCYFDKGYIEETVIEWTPPVHMGLKVDRTNMPGRHWLGFETADYTLLREGTDTVLTRTTTIVSHLYPAWYWRRFERLGVADEHRYIFGDVARRVAPR